MASSHRFDFRARPGLTLTLFLGSFFASFVWQVEQAVQFAKQALDLSRHDFVAHLTAFLF
jgi:hypothetical protein